MVTKQYRLERVFGQRKANGDWPTVGWKANVTHGLMDVEYLGGGRVWEKQAQARAAAKEHAARTGVTPIILT